MRKTPLRRLTSLVRTGRITRKPRSRDEFIRIYGDDEQRAWIQAQPCIITGRSPCEVCHVKTGGMGRKADVKWSVPMIPEKHRELHALGIRTFEAKYDVDLELAAIACHERWKIYCCEVGQCSKA